MSLAKLPDGNDRERIGRLYEIALGRPPTEAEVEIGLQLLADQTAAERLDRLLPFDSLHE